MKLPTAADCYAAMNVRLERVSTTPPSHVLDLRLVLAELSCLHLISNKVMQYQQSDLL